MAQKQTFAASIQEKKGRLYAVIQAKYVTGTKPVWRALGLPVDAPKSTVNKRFREVVSRFEEEFAEMIERANRPEADIPVYEYMREFVEHHKPNIQYYTYESYLGMVEGKIKRYFEERPVLTVGNLRAKDIEKFYDYLFSFGVTSNTVIHYHGVMRKAFHEAFKNDLIDVNPFDKVTRPKKNEFVGDNYSADELTQLLTRVKEDVIFPAIILAGGLGLRRSEALGVRWSRINWEEKTVLLSTKVIEEKVNGKKVAVPVDIMKNKKSHRTMPIPDAVYEMLLEQRQKQEVYKDLFAKSYNHEFDDYVCVNQLGDLIKPSYVTDHFNVLLRQEGMRHIRYHDLRHTVASLLLNKNVQLINVSDFMGHSDIKTTANIYGHLDKSSKIASANVINSVLSTTA